MIVDNTVVNYIQRNMYRIVILFLIFDTAASGNISHLDGGIQHRHNIDLYETKLQAVGFNHLKIVFRVKKEIEHLNGHFSVHHKDCPSSNCGSTKMKTPLSQGQMITIQLASLTPCKSYPVGFETRADKNNGGVKSDKYSQLSWKAISCPHLSTTTTPTTTATTTITSPAELETTTNGNSSTTENGADSSVVIAGAVSSIIIILGITAAVIVLALLFKRKRSGEQKRREEDMPVDENPVYGIYDDGPVYNVVTDENAYYST